MSRRPEPVHEPSRRDIFIGHSRSSVSAPRPIALAWLLTVGVDLFFNAGLFTMLFDQSREPSLLSDEALFRRIPVAYLGLAVGVTALAWLIERLEPGNALSGARAGGAVGAVLAVMGPVSLWTAVEMTGWFVAAAALVQVTQFAVAGSFLTEYRNRASARRARWPIAASLLLAMIGILAQNVIS